MADNFKVVWVTGASSGIGEALVMELAKQPNTKVILSARQSAELERVQKEAGLDSDRGHVLPLDLSQSNSFQAIVESAIQNWGKVDVLISNGGISQRDLAENTSLEVVRRLMEVNFFGNVALSMLLFPHFKKRGSGKYVIVSSVAGKTGTRFRSAYSASKHALHGFYDSLRAEAFEYGIGVTLICPGYVKTKISFNALTGAGKPQNKMDDVQNNGLPPQLVARKIISAYENNREEVVIGGLQEHLGALLKRFFPRLLSRILRKAKVT